MCRHCKKTYTLEQKRHAYSEETQKLALKIYCAGAGGVGKVLGMSKANVYNWIKKTTLTVDNSPQIFDLDELYWYVFHKPLTETKENVYLMTMVSREPRQIVGFDVAYDKSPERIQKIVDSAPSASRYCTDGFLGYIDVAYRKSRELPFSVSDFI